MVELAFGEVAPGGVSKRPLELFMGPSASHLVGIRGTDAEAFRVVLPWHQPLVVEFSPTHRGSHSAELTALLADSLCPMLISLSGTGLPGSVELADSISFGRVALYREQHRKLEVTNWSFDHVRTIGPPAVDYRTGADAAAFRVLSPSADWDAPMLAMGQSAQVTLGFLPTELRTYEGQLIVTFAENEAAGSRREEIIRLTGIGGAPLIGSVPDVLNFGKVPRISPTQRLMAVTQFDLRNTGESALHLEASYPDGGALVNALGSNTTRDEFSASLSTDGGLDIEVGGTRTVVIQFSADSFGSKAAVLNILSDAYDQRQVQVHLQAEAVLSGPCAFDVQPTIDFGPLDGGAVVLGVPFHNFLNSSCILYNVSLESNESGVFELDPARPFSVTVTGQSTYVLPVSVDPRRSTQTGMIQARLVYRQPLPSAQVGEIVLRALIPGS